MGILDDAFLSVLAQVQEPPPVLAPPRQLPQATGKLGLAPLFSSTCSSFLVEKMVFPCSVVCGHASLCIYLILRLRRVYDLRFSRRQVGTSMSMSEVTPALFTPPPADAEIAKAWMIARQSIACTTALHPAPLAPS